MGEKAIGRFSSQRLAVDQSGIHVRLGSLADIGECIRDVRFAPLSGHAQGRHRCQLSATSGHGIIAPLRPIGLPSKKRGGGWYRCSYVSLQLIFHNGPVEGFIAALYAVLELSISLRKLSKYFIWTRRGVPRPDALIEAHHVPGDEAMPGRYMFVQLSHCGAFSCVAQTAKAKRCTPALPLPPCRFPRSES